MITACHLFAAFVSFVNIFIASTFTRLFNSPLFAGLKHRLLAQSSLKTLATKIVSLTLIVSLLTVSTPAQVLPQANTLFIMASEFGQDIRYSFLRGANFAATTDSSVFDNFLPPFLSGVAGGNPLVLALTVGASKIFRPKNKKQQAVRVVILPGDQTVVQGARINFTAIGLGRDDQPVSGLSVKWSVTDTGRNRPARSLESGSYYAAIPGNFSIVAETAQGQQGQVTLTVKADDGFRIRQAMEKPEAARTDKDRALIDEVRRTGFYRTREVSSKANYNPEEERILDNEIKLIEDKIKAAETIVNTTTPVNPNPATTPTRPPSGPNAEDAITETNEIESAEKTTVESADPKAAPLWRSPDTEAWNGTNWATADDPVNQVGSTSGAAPADGASNGNFQISASVISLPGRAGLDVNLALNYNARLWSKSGSTMYYDPDRGSPAPGWTLGFGKMMRMGGTGGCMLVSGDGSRHSYTGSTSTYSLYGWIHDDYTGHTTDGSFIDYTCNYLHNTGGALLSGAAKLPNGTVIEYNSATAAVDQVYPTKITDAQGNYVNITYLNNQGPKIQTITDTLGRVVTFNYDSSGRLVSVTGPGFNNTTRTYVRFHYSQLTLSYAFASGITADTPTNTPYVLDAIYYPDINTGYWFGDSDSYSSYGMIAKVKEMRGMSCTGCTSTAQGTISAGNMTNQKVYNFPLTANSTLTDAPNYSTLTETWANMDNPAVPVVTTYSVTNTSTDEIITVTAPDGVTKSRQTSHNDPGNFDDGLYYQNETLSGTTVLGKVKTFQAVGAYGAARPTRIESTDELGHTTAVEFSYGTVYNQVTEQRQYNYSNALYRKTTTAYENNSAYTNRHIFNLVKSVEAFDAAGVRVAKTDYQYDNNAVVNGTGSPNLVAAPNVVMHNYTSDPYTTMTQQDHNNCLMYETMPCANKPGDCEVCTLYGEMSAYDPNSIFRGNVTKVTTYDNAATPGPGVDYDSTYDVTGNVRTTTTDCCQQMSFDYTVNTQYSQPESHTKGSAVTSSPDRMTESAAYDFNTGAVTTSTDFNGRTTTNYYDAVMRPVQSVLPTGGKTNVAYDDANLSVTQTSLLSDNTTIASKSTSFYNGRGQTISAGQFVGGTSWNAVAMKYDIMGRKAQQSLPYDTSVLPTQWTTFSYDALSRMTQVTAPDGSTTKSFYNETGNRPDSASTAFGQTVRTQDAWGRERWARTDDFGRTVEVVEPNPTGNGSVSATGSLQTTYAYDVKDQLINVTQGSQTRWFAYDSLGRLIRQKLAEQAATINNAGAYVGVSGTGAQWSDAFFYDVRSNLTQRTDARGVITTFSYQNGGVTDPLNRLQQVSYNKTGADQPATIADASTVTLSYMTTGDKTRVSQAQTSWTTEQNTYDTEGRISDYTISYPSSQTQPLTTSYTYDTVNRLTAIQYPAAYGMPITTGKMINPTYDESSRLKELKVNTQVQMSDIAYNPMSQVMQLKTGAATGNADIEQYGYDNQTGLLTNQTVVKANTSAPLLNLSYGYNRGLSNGNVNGKTGQLTSISNNLDHNKERVYEYDALGRLRTAKGGAATGVTATANWTQGYGYDRYGNRSSVTATGITANSQTVPTDGLPTQSYDASSNRINTANYTYDLTGNLTRGQDGAGVWHRYVYDTAGRLVQTNDDNNNLQQSNGYASSRQRLVSNDGTNYTWYVWGGASVISEYTSATWGSSALAWKKSYIYAGSRLLSTFTNNGSGGETLEFHHPDRLGTKLATNNTANTSFEQSTLPFGTDLTAEHVGTITTNQRFTVYDRNTNAQLDYAQNRSYSSGQGRFTSVDPVGMSAASIGNPQSLNLYAYVGNNPIDFTDPSGLNAQAPLAVVTVRGDFDWNLWYDSIWGWGRDYPTTGGDPVDQHEPTHQEEKHPCGEMVNLLRKKINAMVDSAGGVDAFLGFSHSQLDASARILDQVFSQFYLGVDHLDNWKTGNELRHDQHYKDSGARSNNGMDVGPNPYLGQDDFKSDYQEKDSSGNPLSNNDQTHHFAAYFSAGINNVYWGSVGHSIADRLFGAGSADADLGNKAYNIGASLNRRGGWDFSEKPKYRAQRFLSLADTVDDNICNK